MLLIIRKSQRKGLEISTDCEKWALIRKQYEAFWNPMLGKVYRKDAGENWINIVKSFIRIGKSNLPELILDFFCEQKLNWETLSRYIIAKEAFYTDVRLYINISTIKKNYGLFDTFNLNNYKYLLVSSKKNLISIFPKDIVNIIFLYL